MIDTWGNFLGQEIRTLFFLVKQFVSTFFFSLPFTSFEFRAFLSCRLEIATFYWRVAFSRKQFFVIFFFTVFFSFFLKLGTRNCYFFWGGSFLALPRVVGPIVVALVGRDEGHPKLGVWRWPSFSPTWSGHQWAILWCCCCCYCPRPRGRQSY